MTLQQFRSLPKDIQRKIVNDYDVFLFGRTGVCLIAKIYQIDSFYVELFFDTKMSVVTQLKSFEDTAPLEPYLRMVDVKELQLLLKG